MKKKNYMMMNHLAKLSIKNLKLLSYYNIFIRCNFMYSTYHKGKAIKNVQIESLLGL
jgi:hypothetical protein